LLVGVVQSAKDAMMVLTYIKGFKSREKSSPGPNSVVFLTNSADFLPNRNNALPVPNVFGGGWEGLNRQNALSTLPDLLSSLSSASVTNGLHQTYIVN